MPSTDSAPRAVRLPNGDLWRPYNGGREDNVKLDAEPSKLTHDQKVRQALEEGARLAQERLADPSDALRPVCPWCEQDFTDPDRLRTHIVFKHAERVKDDAIQDMDAMRAMARRAQDSD